MYRILKLAVLLLNKQEVLPLFDVLSMYATSDNPLPECVMSDYMLLCRLPNTTLPHVLRSAVYQLGVWHDSKISSTEKFN